ncbi:MAG: class A beta-lactamase-related serine hydrolase [Bacteroidota bacterium]|nr:class A beta-lactamase-related serine hydrolase [Bacteroidota bacterium]
MKKLLAFILLFTSFSVSAQKTDKHLQNDLSTLVKGFNGDVGIYVYDLSKHKMASINSDTIFPTASMVKVPILIGIMHKIFNGELTYHQQLIFTDSVRYSEGQDILASFKNGEKVALNTLLMLMVSMSDNCASLWLQGLAGTGTLINKYLDSLGMKDTRVNSRTEGRKDNWAQYGWGQTTPREMANLMKMIVENKIINKQISERMLRLLGRQFWDEDAISQIPPNIFVADKSGAVDQSRNEVLYVNGKHDYIFCICTKNNKDTSWESNNEAWILTRNLSALLWKHFNHKSKWKAEELLK